MAWQNWGNDCPTGKAADELCETILGGSYDPVNTCVNARTVEASRLPNPETGRPDWGCPALYVNQAPINLNNYDGYGLTAAMGWCASAVGLFAMLVFLHQVLKADMGKPKMIKVSKAIQAGARAFLHREFFFIGIYAIVMFASMCGFLYNGVVEACDLNIRDQGNCNPFVGQPSLTTLGVFTGLCFLTGGLMSACAGYLGMWIATRANVRTCWACHDSMNAGLRVAFKSGSVMGLAVVCLGLMGLQICWLILSIDTIDQRLVWQYLSGFGFGGSMIALFARVAGGIYTKAADVGADLVGKVEAGIPEDSPNNPAVIADNVGDNVGDVAGMGADLLESYVGALIAACTLGYEMYSKLSAPREAYCCLFGVSAPPLYTIPTNFALAAVAYPLWLAGIGILCSIMGIYVVRTNANESMPSEQVLVSLLWSIRYGVYFASIVFAGLAALVAWMIMGNSGQEWQCYGCALIGLFGGNVIGAWTEYCTSYSEQPVKSIAKKSITGPATVIIQGFGVGMLSTSIPLIVLVGTIIACDAIQSNYGIAIAAISMLATLGITLATDAYGPVADNAGGIAEMCHNEVKDTTRGRTDALDAMGNTTAATGKGYAIASAALTSVALIAAFVDAAGLLNVNVDDAVVLAGVFIGAMLAFVFAALTMLAVGRAAEDIIFEVRDQFAREPRLRDGDWEGPEGVPNYERCVTIATNSAIMEMVTPSALAIFSPFIVGYMLGSRCLTGMLVGNVTSGILLAVTMATAGGAWDNAKKYVEKDGLGPGKGKKTSFHAATVVGDTVGDPFKDTSGPALNIFIKMSALLSIVLAPSFKAVNPSGTVFPNNTFWIGIIIWVIVTIVIIVFNYFMLKKYEKNAQMLEAARGQDVTGAATEPAAAAAAAPPAATPAATEAAPVATQ
jgi:H(+)-translocating pyrophosphatase